MVVSKKFTEEEIKELTDLRNKYTEITVLFGQLEIQKEMLTRQLDQVKKTIVENWENYNNLILSEDTIIKKLNEKYGEGTLDLDSGEFIPNN
jgi:hypothetical protein